MKRILDSVRAYSKQFLRISELLYVPILALNL